MKVPKLEKFEWDGLDRASESHWLLGEWATSVQKIVLFYLAVMLFRCLIRSKSFATMLVILPVPVPVVVLALFGVVILFALVSHHLFWSNRG